MTPITYRCPVCGTAMDRTTVVAVGVQVFQCPQRGCDRLLVLNYNRKSWAWFAPETHGAPVIAARAAVRKATGAPSAEQPG